MSHASFSIPPPRRVPPKWQGDVSGVISTMSGTISLRWSRQLAGMTMSNGLGTGTCISRQVNDCSHGIPVPVWHATPTRSG